MTPISVPGTNVTLLPPSDWDETKDGPCLALKLIQSDGVFTSFWKPDEKEIASLMAGGLISISILSPIHPPIAVGTVDDPT